MNPTAQTNTAAPACAALRFILLPLLFISSFTASAQAVTEIITDYNQYWKSSAAAANPAKPDNSHNLLAFTYQGQRYSTGVNDALLTARGDHFIAGDYQALPVTHLPGAPVGNTKIALGALYDTVANGAGSTPPSSNLAGYLTDGAKGLNIGTGIANLVAGALTFGVSHLQQAAIGDGVPDILITQIADPSASSDHYEFIDAGGNVVGNGVNITVQNLPALGTWTGDFYEAAQNPPTLTAGFTRTDRRFRIWAADFSVFGISVNNIHRISSFRLHLNGDSDVAFVAYNHTVMQLLPVTLTFFKPHTIGNQPHLVWQTAAESGTSHFVVEAATDGVHFYAQDSVPAAGNSTAIRNYSYRCPVSFGVVYYRLKQVDLDGRFTYSAVVAINLPQRGTALLLAPNPASGRVAVVCPEPAGSMHLYNAAGTLVKLIPRFENSKRFLSLHGLGPGIYTLQFNGVSGQAYTGRLVVQ